MAQYALTHPCEIAYAEVLAKKGIRWSRPRARTFPLPGCGTSYTPDFYLPDSDIYVEVIGTRQRWSQLRPKLREFRRIYPSIALRIVGEDGNEWVAPMEGRIRFAKKRPSGPGMDTREAGRLGGEARAGRMTPEQRSAGAVRAARARWSDKCVTIATKGVPRSLWRSVKIKAFSNGQSTRSVLIQLLDDYIK